MPPQTGSEVSIRSACTADAAALADLCTQLGYPASSQEIVERLAALDRRADSAIYVAEVGQQVIGWVQGLLSGLLITTHHAEIGGLVVDKWHQRSGIGRRLMAAVEQWARDRGCTEVSLRSSVIREDAHRFYEALGYRCVKTSLTFHKRL
jgi:GNAT superfamily N-acetyltransferase